MTGSEEGTKVQMQKKNPLWVSMIILYIWSGGLGRNISCTSVFREGALEVHGGWNCGMT